MGRVKERKRAFNVPRLSSTLPVRAKLVDSAEKWPWSSAGAHFAGTDGGGLLCLGAWAAFFGAPDVAAAAAAWREYVEAPIAEAIANALRVRRTVPFNRVTWDAPWEGEVRVVAAPGARPKMYTEQVNTATGRTSSAERPGCPRSPVEKFGDIRGRASQTVPGMISATPTF